MEGWENCSTFVSKYIGAICPVPRVTLDKRSFASTMTMQASLPVIVFGLHHFLPTAGESNQREPPPDFVPTYLRRLSAKSPQLALRFAMGFRHTDFLYAAFAVNMGHIRNGGGQCNLESEGVIHFLYFIILVNIWKKINIREGNTGSGRTGG